jgi:hypothetical protein
LRRAIVKLVTLGALAALGASRPAFAVEIPDKRVHTVKLGTEVVRWQGADADRESLDSGFVSVHVPVGLGFRAEAKYWRIKDERERSASVNVFQHRSGILLGAEYAYPWLLRWTAGVGAEAIETTAETRLEFEGDVSGDSRTRRELGTTARLGADYAIIEHVEVSLHFGWRERAESEQSDYFYGVAGGASF